MSDELAEHWETRYRERTRAWSGKVNPTLVSVASSLTPGTALDLACGEGADVLWLASAGWVATGVDISPTAVSRGREAAADAGVAGATFVAADLSAWTPDAAFDLVCSSFLHSEVEFPRIEILRAAAGWVAPGGHFLTVTHAEAPWWSALAHEHHALLRSPEEDAAALALDPQLWDVVEVGVREREAVSPDGEPGVLRDGVLLFRRRP
ncbi:class I SAM-dependent methyltransferase [Demequina sp.]|uniref:class I SAM-dependent methyltransferase n=1 Tax=Demequina sp. TaxID=2050685 RepID=UPI003D0C62AC